MATNMAALDVLSKRSDADILAQAAIKVQFGGTTYDVKPLRILAAQSWRARLVDSIQEIMSITRQDATVAPAFLKGMAFIFLQFPEKLQELVFAYGVDLPRDQVLEEGTDEQMARAFGQIVQVAFPFGSELRTMTHIMAAAATIPTSASSTLSR